MGPGGLWQTDMAMVQVLLQGESAPRWVGRHRNEHQYSHFGCLWRFTLCNMREDASEAWLNSMKVNTTVPCYQFADGGVKIDDWTPRMNGHKAWPILILLCCVCPSCCCLACGMQSCISSELKIARQEHDDEEAGDGYYVG